MRILISNDDGIHAEGIHILAQHLKEIADIYIAAPQSEQSGTSHGLTTTLPIRARRCPLPELTENAWAIDGTPADCVKLAIDVLMPEPPDIVLSGINNGPNLGTDIIYSGTVAAAMEGYLNGYPALAISAAGIRRGKGIGNYHYAGELAAKLCLQMAEQDFKPRLLLNINVPGNHPDDVLGVVYTHMGWRWYTEPFAKRIDPRGQDYFWLQGEFDDRNCGEGSDVEASNQGYATITPIQADFTNYSLLDKLPGYFTFDGGF
ncbi:MAG: 5'/3'-nucleotidase SurE [Clostridia bacterium]|nr:5'/3'-nucleotidase SurE [Clostridia bacterium]